MIRHHIMHSGFAIWRVGFVGCLAAATLSGCWEPQTVFEKRYVRIEIPGYTAEDYLRLLASDDPDLRYLALANIIEDKLTNQEAVSKRLSSLLQDPSQKVRALAVFSVKSVDPEKFDAALLTLSRDRSSDVRLESAVALGSRCGVSPKAGHALLSRLDDANVLVRLQVENALRECTASPLRTEVVTRLQAALPQRSQLEQLMLVNTLGAIGHREEVESQLLNLLASEDSAMVRVVTEALAQQRSALAVPVLAELLAQKRGDLQLTVSALGSIGTPEAIQTLLLLLDADDEALRVAAIEAIGDAEGNEGLAELAARLARSEVRISSDVDSPQWVDLSENYPELPALLKAIDQKRLGSQDPIDQATIAQLLASGQAHEQLIGLQHLAGERPYDRRVVQIEGETQDLFPHLEALCGHASPLMRVFALKAIGNTVDARALPILEAATKDSTFGIRYAAIEALGAYAENTGNYTPLARLYGMKDQLVPEAYNSTDHSLLTRQAVEKVIARGERSDVTHRRQIAELAAASARPTRLFAALQLKDQAALAVLLEFLETGTPSEKLAALQRIEVCCAPAAETIPKLQALSEKEPDKELREDIEQVVEKLKKKSDTRGKAPSTR